MNKTTVSFSIGNGVMVCADSKGKTSEELRKEFLAFVDERGELKEETEFEYYEFVETYGCFV